MTTEDKREIVSALKEHIDREELHTSEAAKHLNLNPIYVSLAKNEKNWDSISRAAWERLEEWFFSRAPLKDFQIPEGEEIYKAKEKTRSIHAQESKEPDEHSPEAVFTPGDEKPLKRHYKPRAEKPGKSVKIIINQAEIAALNKRVDLLTKDLNDVAGILKESEINVGVLINLVNEEKVKTEELQAQVKDLQEGMGHLVTIPKAESKPGIVVFQRNIYKS